MHTGIVGPDTSLRRASMVWGVGVTLLAAWGCGGRVRSDDGGSSAARAGSSGGTSSSGGMSSSGGVNSSGGVSTGGIDACATGGMTSVAMPKVDGTFDCPEPVPAPNCDGIHEWGTFCWGGLFTYNDVRLDRTNTRSLHATGSVASGNSGFGVYFNACQDLSAYRSVTFTLSGSTGSLDAPNAVRFMILENADQPSDSFSKVGGCNGRPGIECQSPYVSLNLREKPQTILFSDLGHGTPLALLDPTQVRGFQWDIALDRSLVPFDVDVTLEDLTFDAVGNAPVTECSLVP